jgi:type IV pilus assembly protein PilQ
MRSALLALALALPCSSAVAAPRVSLDVKDAEIRNVLRFLADLGKINVVVSDEVNGRVTLHLRNVAFEDAFRAVLEPKGLATQQIGEIRYVDSLERLTKRQEAEARMLESKKILAPLRTILVPVAYQRAESLLPIVKTLLSERGHAEVDVRTNTLIVTDVDPDRAARAL